ncbi:MobC family plasmid mobilization relaxosome protein [Dyadobacter chenwenxiniae]|uniref:MobC family plasmid mobilization relaxosome protein n=1 Tax=Dyadobacter chenwenxiniae TaxID=2906456 RepID=A0A9X1PN46_9BACT|nr:plasmid mobilization relaxosome protein MobC [Dyadobacter chenwenxiniae]MCF0064417.1 MobC family plasmid mobilization relaxosome protein [Dyadobacter chenwenxiniae]UON82377.1 MobC family plasmid mobilization relaxosome protein [Dyadobacter chenwenxiniae]
MEETEIKDRKHHNPKGGRPPKKVKRQNQLMVRLSEIERFLIEEKARYAGMKPSAWLRQSAKKAKVLARLRPDDLKHLRTLTGMANNLNQLTHLAHKEGLTLIRQSCQELLLQIDLILKKVSSDDR